MAFKLLIVNYHYIRDQAPVRGIYNVTPSFFSDQLDAISAAGFNFISLDDLHRAIALHSLQFLPPKACLITFDDGLRESYELGLAVMDSKGIPGAFYLSSMTLSRKHVLDVHKFHHIQAFLSNEDILGQIPQAIEKRLNVVDETKISSQYIWDDRETARVKYLFNFLLEEDERAALICELFEGCVHSEADFALDLYMTSDQVRELSLRSYLGSHGRLHVPLASLPPHKISEEIVASKQEIEAFCGTSIESISYPYGMETAINDHVLNEAECNSFLTGMTMIRGLNTGYDILLNPLSLRRFDTNDVFGGKTECMHRDYFYE